MELTKLTAISPIDGRYARQTDALRDIFSECAFMNARVRVEVEWLISLSEAGFAELPHLSDHGKAFLRGLADNFSLADCEAIKEIEKPTNHDVKAVEYWIKNQVAHDEELAGCLDVMFFCEDGVCVGHMVGVFYGFAKLVFLLDIWLLLMGKIKWCVDWWFVWLVVWLVG